MRGRDSDGTGALVSEDRLTLEQVALMVQDADAPIETAILVGGVEAVTAILGVIERKAEGAAGLHDGLARAAGIVRGARVCIERGERL